MSDLENSACTGSCDSCGSDCNLDLSNPNATVTLTLDDDSELVCAVLTIFPAGEHKYIALLPLDENGENQDVKYSYTVSSRKKDSSRLWKTSKTMTNTRSLLMLSMNC